MSATQNITDSWMEQIDVQSRINAAHWEDEWISVYERRDSYVEHFLGFLLPVSPQRAAKTMTDPSWDRSLASAIAFAHARSKFLQSAILRHFHYSRVVAGELSIKKQRVLHEVQVAKYIWVI